MLEHRMTGKIAQLGRDPQHHRLRVHALKLDLALAEIGFHAGQRAEKIIVPKRASEFAVSDGLKANIFLFLDNCCDLTVLYRLELIRGDFIFLSPRTRFLQRRSAQQTSDVIGAEGGLGALRHWRAFSFVMTGLDPAISLRDTMPP